MKQTSILSIILFLLCFKSFSQPIGMSIQETQKKEIKIEELERNYKSAIATPPEESVFKSEELQGAYSKLLEDFGKFLAKNNFKWEKKAKCFQRIYFNNDGSIDYFIFNFLGKDEDKPTIEKQAEFNRLLNLFIQDYKFALTAKVKFAQCSPTSYMP